MNALFSLNLFPLVACGFPGMQVGGDLNRTISGFKQCGAGGLQSGENRWRILFQRIEGGLVATLRRGFPVAFEFFSNLLPNPGAAPMPSPATLGRLLLGLLVAGCLGLEKAVELHLSAAMAPAD